MPRAATRRAREALEAFWRKVSRGRRVQPVAAQPARRAARPLVARPLARLPRLRHDGARLLALRPRLRRPNPLAKILSESIDFARLAAAPIKLFITATNVRTGRPRVFRNAELSPDVLLASACLPSMFQAVEIDGEAYWDGGYSGNPTMTPLVQECVSDDTILVAINPVERPGMPRSARDILNRLNEVSFNAVLLKELRMMALLRKVASAGDGEGRALGAYARPHDPQRHAGRARLLLEAQCRMGVPHPAARRGPARGRRLPRGARRGSRATLDARHRSPAGRRLMGLAGVLLGLALLVWLAFRGWTVLLLAPAAALVAAAFAGEPLLAHWTQTFMGSAAQFLAQFFPLFLMGALFGKLMEDSGSVTRDRALDDGAARHGPRHAGRGAGRRAGHLWRRQPVRRLLRAGADGRGAVPHRRHPAPADAGGDRARHLDLHHVGAARHAGDPERHPDAVLRHDALRRARGSA